jgi:hypothetical protein
MLTELQVRRNPLICGCSSMVAHQLPRLTTYPLAEKQTFIVQWMGGCFGPLAAPDFGVFRSV